jgi:outer membrane biosynthesis protein TonB
MIRKLGALLTAVALTMMLAVTATSIVLADVEHCPGHSDSANTKVEATGGNQEAVNNLVLPAGTQFCVKSSTGNTGVLVANGTTTLREYLEAAGIVGGDGQGRDVSYYVIYAEEPTATPTEEPTPTPAATPTPTPTEEPEPNLAAILFVKIIDEDGNLETDDDWTPGVNWQFSLDLSEGNIEEEQSVADEDGFGYFVVSFDGDSTNALISEELRAGFTFVDALCFDLSEGEAAVQGLSGVDALVGPTSHWGFDIGELEGTGVRFDVEAWVVYGCVFFNSPVPAPTQPPTQPPPTQPPPTPTLPPTTTAQTTASGGDPGAVLPVLLIGLMAAAWLFLRPPTSIVGSRMKLQIRR